VVGRWEDYGLQAPTHVPLEKHPTVNSGVLDALRHGRLVARPGIERYDGHTVHFTDGTQEEFDAIIMATGFRTSFPFLSERVADWDMATTPPLYLKMMHPTIPACSSSACSSRSAASGGSLTTRPASRRCSSAGGCNAPPTSLRASATRSPTHIIGSTRRPGTRSRSTITPSGASSWTSLPPPRREAQGSRPC
jgi:Flavin-binding monooxygenase-like